MTMKKSLIIGSYLSPYVRKGGSAFI